MSLYTKHELMFRLGVRDPVIRRPDGRCIWRFADSRNLTVSTLPDEQTGTKLIPYSKSCQHYLWCVFKLPAYPPKTCPRRHNE